MKLLITNGPKYSNIKQFLLNVREAEIVRGYFDNDDVMQPLVLMEEKGDLSRCTTSAKGLNGFCEYFSRSEYGSVRVGILEATDEELNVLRSAGYEVRDLRTATLAYFLEDIGES